MRSRSLKQQWDHKKKFPLIPNKLVQVQPPSQITKMCPRFKLSELKCLRFIYWETAVTSSIFLSYSSINTFILLFWPQQIQPLPCLPPPRMIIFLNCCFSYINYFLLEIFGICLLWNLTLLQDKRHSYFPLPHRLTTDSCQLSSLINTKTPSDLFTHTCIFPSFFPLHHPDNIHKPSMGNIHHLSSISHHCSVAMLTKSLIIMRLKISADLLAILTHCSFVALLLLYSSLVSYLGCNLFCSISTLFVEHYAPREFSPQLVSNYYSNTIPNNEMI